MLRSSELGPMTDEGVQLVDLGLGGDVDAVRVADEAACQLRRESLEVDIEGARRPTEGRHIRRVWFGPARIVFALGAVMSVLALPAAARATGITDIGDRQELASCKYAGAE